MKIQIQYELKFTNLIMERNTVSLIYSLTQIQHSKPIKAERDKTSLQPAATQEI